MTALTTLSKIVSALDEPFGPGGELPDGLAGEGGTPTWAWVVIALALAVGAGLLGWLAFRRFMFAAYGPDEVFGRVQALASLGGLSGGAQLTPYQFGERLAAFMPLHRQRLSLIVESYVQSRYGGRAASEERQNELADAWLNLRFPLLMAAMGQRVYPRRIA